MITVEPNLNDRLQTPPAIKFSNVSIDELIATLHKWEVAKQASSNDVIAATEQLQTVSQHHGYNEVVVKKLRTALLDLIESGPSRRLNGVLRRFTETAFLNNPEQGIVE